MELLKFHRFIKNGAKKLVFYTPHAMKQMDSEDRIITVDEVEFVIFNGDIVEDYLEDKRGHSCLINGYFNERFIHVVCAPKEDYLAIITAYIHDKKQWINNFSKRKD